MVPLICPVTREALELQGDMLVAAKSGNSYPVVDGIPVLLPDAAERNRITGVNWTAPNPDASSRLGFYNATQNNALHASTHSYRATVEAMAEKVRGLGATLEIGSGGGAMQGIGDEYVALDYGFTALREYINPKYQRVCGTAESLPFADRSIAFVLTIDALEHVPRVDAAFDEIDRVLKPGGMAVLKPAWHCRQYSCEGIPVLKYSELNLRQKLSKATLPLHRHVAVRAAWTLPRRAVRRLAWAAGGSAPTRLHFGKLKPNYERPLCADSDACSSIDSHEAALFFHSRGYAILSPGSAAGAQILARHGPLIVQKPS